MIVVTIILSLLTFVTASSIDILCKFDDFDYNSLGDVYSCIVKNDLQVYTTDVAINEVTGSHKSGKSNDQIFGLVIKNKKTDYLPSNLGEKFQDLKALRVKNGRLKEIHQDDLKMFTKLVHLNLDENNIEALDDDLFEFNTELKVIWFGKNKIKSIGKSIFDKLTNLAALDLMANICTKVRASSGKEVKSAISKINENCFKPEIELENLKLRHQKLKDKNTKAAMEIEELKEDNLMTTGEVLILKIQLERSSKAESSDIDLDQPNAAPYNVSTELNGLEIEASTNQTESTNFKATQMQKDLTLAELKFAKKSLERQLKIQIIKSQAMESNLTAAVNQCEVKNRQFEVVRKLTKIRSEAVERNLTDSISVLTHKLKNLKYEKMKLERAIKELKDKLEAEEFKYNQCKDTNSENVEQLTICQKNNIELSIKIDRLSNDLQNVRNSLTDERRKSQSKTTEYNEALSSVGNKFDDIQMNLTKRFESLYNQTYKLLDDQPESL